MTDDIHTQPPPIRSLPMTQSVADAYLAGVRSADDAGNPHPKGTNEAAAWDDGRSAHRRKRRLPEAELSPTVWLSSAEVFVRKPTSPDDEHGVALVFKHAGGRIQVGEVTAGRARLLAESILNQAARAERLNLLAREQ